MGSSRQLFPTLSNCILPLSFGLGIYAFAAGEHAGPGQLETGQQRGPASMPHPLATMCPGGPVSTDAGTDNLWRLPGSPAPCPAAHKLQYHRVSMAGEEAGFPMQLTWHR